MQEGGKKVEMENTAGVTPILLAKDQPGFVLTPQVKDIIHRAFLYLETGFPVHFMGPAGTGKTSLAMYLAAQRGRPIILIHGDEEYNTSDLVGGEYGYRRKKMVDNFIHSVRKSEENVSARWVDHRLTVACKYGFTLAYDEFTRSRAEANNILLSVLEERILDLPAARGEDSYLRVHPNFAAIFTSNPEEYAGVHRAQDALRDRMVTIKLSPYDRETEIAITQAKAGIPRLDAERIVNIVRELRESKDNGSTPTVRAGIMIGKVLRLTQARAAATDENFTWICLDILDPESSNNNNIGTAREAVKDLIAKYC